MAIISKRRRGGSIISLIVAFAAGFFVSKADTKHGFLDSLLKKKGTSDE